MKTAAIIDIPRHPAAVIIAEARERGKRIRDFACAGYHKRRVRWYKCHVLQPITTSPPELHQCPDTKRIEIGGNLAPGRA